VSLKKKEKGARNAEEQKPKKLPRANEANKTLKAHNNYRLRLSSRMSAVGYAGVTTPGTPNQLRLVGPFTLSR